MFKQKNSLYLLLVISLFLASNLPSRAQMVDPVSWSYALKPVNDSIYELHFTAAIEPTWHMYNQVKQNDGPEPLSFTFEPSVYYQRIDTVLEITPAHKEFDKMFNLTVHFFAVEAEFMQKIKILKQESFKIKGTIDFQICDDKSCSLGDTDFSFDIEQTAGAKTESAMVTAATDSSAPASGSSRNLWKLFWIAFGSGLIALLTPCVFPMIPMTVSFFMHGEKSRKKSLFEALFFGVSIVAIFAVIGTIVAVAFGPGIANFMSTHWIPNVLFFLVFLFFAAWFFGMFEINLPNWMISKSDQRADKGGLSGPFFMAFTTVLVSFSCTGPIVGTVLVQSAGGEILQPIIGMLGFGIAFALPFTLFAIFPSWLTSLPKSGGG